MIKNLILLLALATAAIFAGQMGSAANLMDSYNHSHQPSNCEAGEIQYDISVDSSELKMDYSRYSHELNDINGIADSHRLAAYSSKRHFKISPLVQSYQVKDGYCSKVVKVKAHVQLEPIIYISKQAQQFECSKNRAHEHELLHHQFELQANIAAQKDIKTILARTFSAAFSTATQQQIATVIDDYNQQAIKQIQSYLYEHSAAKHASIDTPQAYQQDSTRCSEQENHLLLQSL